MENNCIFCKIINREIPSEIMFENDFMLVIKDLDPKAKNHFLVLPKTHYKLLLEMSEEESVTLGKILATIPTLAEELELKDGYRLVINQGENAGQTVFHLHIHLLSGQKMGWTPA